MEHFPPVSGVVCEEVLVERDYALFALFFEVFLLGALGGFGRGRRGKGGAVDAAVPVPEHAGVGCGADVAPDALFGDGGVGEGLADEGAAREGGDIGEGEVAEGVEEEFVREGGEGREYGLWWGGFAF